MDDPSSSPSSDVVGFLVVVVFAVVTFEVVVLTLGVVTVSVSNVDEVEMVGSLLDVDVELDEVVEVITGSSVEEDPILDGVGSGVIVDVGIPGSSVEDDPVFDEVGSVAIVDVGIPGSTVEVAVELDKVGSGDIVGTTSHTSKQISCIS